MSARRTGAAAFTGAVLGQTWLARRLARLIDRSLKAVLWGLVVVVILVRVWWDRQTAGMHLLVVLAVVALAAAWLQHTIAGRHGRRPVVLSAGRPTLSRQAPSPKPLTLYFWHEPADLPDGLFCWCGKPRVAGELVYTGKTARFLDERIGEHADDRHWYHPELVGSWRSDFASALDLALGEQYAYDTLHPRENRKRPSLTGT